MTSSVQAGIYLEEQNWQTLEGVLASNPQLVIPLGAAAKEHGPHLPMNTDAITATWLAEQIRQRLPVVIAPLVNASFFPAFVEYPGSINLRIETARDLLLDVCHSLAAFGAKRFYVINNGVSTLAPLKMARQTLRDETIQFDFLELTEVWNRLPQNLFQQSWGSHADEHETSLMLHIAPQLVDMSKAVDDGKEGDGLLSREKGCGIYSASGVYGQPTLANKKKGKILAGRMVDTIVEALIHQDTNRI